MKLTRKITEDIIYVGGEDRKIHLFEHHIPIRKGVTYNSYLILDEKTALMDTADQDISRQFIENVEGELKGKKLGILAFGNVGRNVARIRMRGSGHGGTRLSHHPSQATRPLL